MTEELKIKKTFHCQVLFIIESHFSLHNCKEDCEILIKDLTDLFDKHCSEEFANKEFATEEGRKRYLELRKQFEKEKARKLVKEFLNWLKGCEKLEIDRIKKLTSKS